MTTKKKGAKASATTVTRGNLTKRMGRGGAISITTTKKAVPQNKGNLNAAAKRALNKAVAGAQGVRVGAGNRPQVKKKVQAKPLTRTIKGELSESARLDGELFSTNKFT